MLQRHIGDFTVQLVRYPRAFPMNCYLVREDDGLTLVDSTMAGAASGIRDAALSLQLPIVRLLLTHAHIDHAGSIDALHVLYPDAELIIGSREARLLVGDKSLEENERPAKLRGSFVRVATPVSRTIGTGESVGSLECVATPGHSPGHMSFLDARDGTLLAGDAFQTRGAVAVSGTVVWSFPFPAIATWNKSLALDSAQLLRDRKPSRLCVGHGPTIEQPLAAMDRAIEIASRRLGS